MNCVPRINYLLHSLPLKIPDSYFKRLNMIFKDFLWNGKRARINMKKLKRPVNSGGLGLPNLVYYYYAFNLRHIGLYLQREPPRGTAWSSLCQPPSLSSTVCPLNYLNMKGPILSYLTFKVYRKRSPG